MVKLTNNYLLKKSNKPINLRSPEEKETFFRGLTHLCLNEKFIDQIGDISQCKYLKILYLHNNLLTKITNLECAVSITHLYLQRNKIYKIQGLNSLHNLRKLYLGHNRISVIEGLENLSSLEELYIEEQTIPTGETLYFDPRSANGISGNLQILDISGNQLTSLRDLAPLVSLEEVDASRNALSDMDDVCETLGQWICLKQLSLGQNPVCRQQKYRDRIILATYRLAALDGKEITEMTRSFLQRFEMTRAERKKLNMKRDSGDIDFSPEIASLAEHLPPGLRRSVSKAANEELRVRNSRSLSLSQIPLQVIVDGAKAGRKGIVPQAMRRVSNAETETLNRRKQAVLKGQVRHGTPEFAV